MVTVRVDGQGRIQLPKVVREAMGIEPGDKLRLVGENGKITLTKVREP